MFIPTFHKLRQNYIPMEREASQKTVIYEVRYGTLLSRQALWRKWVIDQDTNPTCFVKTLAIVRSTKPATDGTEQTKRLNRVKSFQMVFCLIG